MLRVELIPADNMRFDDLVVYLGEFGPYQKKIYFLLCYPMLVAAFHKLIWVFVAADLQHVCQPPIDNLDNLTDINNFKKLWNHSVPWIYNDKILDRCSISDISTNRTSDAVNCDSWIFDTTQYSSSVVSDFNLVCDRKWLKATTMSLQMGGEFFGSILLGILSDKYGRKKIMVLSSLVLSISGVVASFSTGIVMLMICRIMIGFWTPGTVLIAYVVGLEFVGPSKRVFAGIVSQYFFAVGFILIAAVAYFIRDWRTLTLALSLPGFVMITFYWIVPESVRWLLTNNKKQEAVKIIKVIAKQNKVHLPEEFYKHEFVIEKKPNASIKELMRHPNLRRRTFIVGFCWFVNTCVYYGLSLNTSNLAGDHYINFALAAAVEFPAYTLCLLVLDRFGRRLPLCLSMVVGGLALFIIPFLPSDASIIIVVLPMIGKFAITTSYAIIYFFSTEIFPTAVRSASTGLSSTCGRIGAIIVPYILLLGTTVPQILFSIFGLTAGLLCLLLPETLGREMPDTIEDGENFTKGNWHRNGTKTLLKDQHENGAVESLELNKNVL